LIRAGQASAGSNWCPDLGRPCHTHPGTYRVNSLGSPGCKSSQFPIPHGGAPMPYCMFFDRNQALHGSPDREVVDGNISHGCVRMHVPDAEWLRYNFVSVGTKVIVEPY
jgi:lipoprotein-anchoring transpeptidase ErfK/SrfK